ncbi:MAG TPA: hypothetical protein VJ547_12055 [Candidatus Thermoplasmatota archaeon]|nr:hypothetical protein [Candidatus Thermoplasmatota archaeon]
MPQTLRCEYRKCRQRFPTKIRFCCPYHKAAEHKLRNKERSKAAK